MPADILCIIASYLPFEELQRLCGVNRPFFDLWMKERYRRLRVDGDMKMKWLREHIVGQRARLYVQQVEFAPWKIRERIVQKRSRASWPGAFRMLSQGAEGEWSTKEEEILTQRKVEKVAKEITDAWKQLPNVQEFKVKCSNGNCQSSLVRGLLPALSIWEDTLIKLSLCVPPENLNHCLPPVNLKKLETLELIFCWKPTEDFQGRVLEPLTVFVNNLNSTLRSLSLFASRDATDINLAHLFRFLGSFRHLRHFEISMPFDGSSMSDTGHLLLFLRRHRRLQSLKLGTNPAAVRKRPPSIHQKEWIPLVLKSLDSSFGDLQRLDVSLRPSKQPVTFDALVNFLSTHGHNLTSLTLTEEMGLSFQEVQRILKHPRGFHLLEQLALNVEVISASLFIFLATSFPRLQQLEIRYMRYFLIGSELEMFFEELRASQHSYKNWPLKHVGITLGSYLPHSYMPHIRMETILMESIPSLKTVVFR